MPARPAPTPAAPTGESPARLRFWAAFGVLTVLTAGAYFDTVLKAADRWSNDPQYSHGFLVPLFSLYLLYQRRGLIAGRELFPSLWALVALGLAVALRFAEAVYFYNGLDPLSLVPAFAAVLLASGGVPALRWGWPAAGFLVFMVPLPFRIQTLLSGQLQSLATAASSAVLVALGYPAVTEGNVILLGEIKVGVVEACSGLGMVVTFAALSAGFALLVRSPVWIKVALLLGSLPVALLANGIRICATAILSEADRREAAQALYHDLAGWFMIPLGCAFILVELWLLNRVLVAAPAAGADRPLELGFPAPLGVGKR